MFLFLILPIGLGCSIVLVIGEIFYFKKENRSEKQKMSTALTTTTMRKTPSQKAQKLMDVMESQPEKK